MHANVSPEILEKWQTIRVKINELAQIPRNRVAERRREATNLTMELLKIATSIVQDPVLKSEYEEVATKILPQHMNAQYEVIEHYATEFFRKRFADIGRQIVGDPIFTTKPNGDQLGRKMLITYIDDADPTHTPRQIAYFLKTHQHGSKSGQSNSSPADPKELFVYKLFDNLGVGPKAYFFSNPLSRGGIYIATQDAGFSKDLNKHKIFSDFQKIREALEKVHDDNAQNPASVCAIQGITLLDILSRVLRLYDITTNPTNFGRVDINEQYSKWKVIDFRVDSMDHYTFNDIFKGFQAGNGMYQYDGSLVKILRDRDEQARMQTALQVVADLQQGLSHRNKAGHKMPFLSALQNALHITLSFTQDNARAFGLRDLKFVLGILADMKVAEMKPEELFNIVLTNDDVQLGDFGRYVKAVFTNFMQLEQSIRARFEELQKPPLSAKPQH